MSWPVLLTVAFSFLLLSLHQPAWGGGRGGRHSFKNGFTKDALASSSPLSLYQSSGVWRLAPSSSLSLYQPPGVWKAQLQVWFYERHHGIFRPSLSLLICWSVEVGTFILSLNQFARMWRLAPTSPLFLPTCWCVEGTASRMVLLQMPWHLPPPSLSTNLLECRGWHLHPLSVPIFWSVEVGTFLPSLPTSLLE